MVLRPYYLPKKLIEWHLQEIMKMIILWPLMWRELMIKREWLRGLLCIYPFQGLKKMLIE